MKRFLNRIRKPEDSAPKSTIAPENTSTTSLSSSSPPPHPVPSPPRNITPVFQLQMHLFLITEIHTSVSLFLETHHPFIPLSLTSIHPDLNAIISSNSLYFSFSQGGPQPRALPTTFAALPVNVLLKVLMTNISLLKGIDPQDPANTVILPASHPANTKRNGVEESVPLGFADNDKFKDKTGWPLPPVSTAISDASMVVRGLMGYEGTSPLIGGTETDDAVLDMLRAGLRLCQVLGERYYDVAEWEKVRGRLEEKVEAGRNKANQGQEVEVGGVARDAALVWKEVCKKKKAPAWQHGEVRIIMGGNTTGGYGRGPSGGGGDGYGNFGGAQGSEKKTVWAGQPGVIEDRSASRRVKEDIGDAMSKW